MRLSTTVSFGLKMAVSYVLSSTFSDLTFEIANLFAKPRDSHPVGFIFYIFQLLEFSAIHQEYRPVTSTLFIQQWPSALERSTVP